jgi:hypothetical protein
MNWARYQGCLSDLLFQMKKHTEKERYLIGAFCATLDAFHFTVDANAVAFVEASAVESASAKEGACDELGNPPKTLNDLDSEARQNANVWRGLNRRIIPRAEGLLTKEGVDKKGSRTKTLRSPVALALMKLYQKLPAEVLDKKLNVLILANCAVLKEKQLSNREAARKTLAKMAASLGPRFLKPVLAALSSNLKEGYQLHVRVATAHSILLALFKASPDPNTISKEEQETEKEVGHRELDLNIPVIMDLIQKDIFGAASEIKEVEYVKKKLVKEAKGQKSYATIELLSRMLHFAPTARNDKEPTSSSVHGVVLPLLERLQSPTLTPSSLRKINECLSKVVIGLSTNPSLKAIEVFPFVHSTIASSLVGQANFDDLLASDSEDSDDDEDMGNTIQIIGNKPSRSLNSKDVSSGHDKKKAGTVASWNPATETAPKDKNTARIANKRQKTKVNRVLDGASAPKLTGRRRHGVLGAAIASNLNDPSKACAISFGLSLLFSFLKKVKVKPDDNALVRSMADPFVPILTNCLTTSGMSDEIALLALRSLTLLLGWNLPSMVKWQKKLSSNVLQLLVSSGGTSSTNSEVSQGCFKSLALLLDREKLKSTSDNEHGDFGKEMPLSEEEMNVLISLLRGCVSDIDHYNSTFALIKAIVAWRFLSPELYDLMETILNLTVQSQRDTVRLAASQTFVNFLVSYPLDQKRFDTHLKQMVLNMKYEYASGRRSAIQLLATLIQKLPVDVLQRHVRMFFLPLVLQLVNDESQECREDVADTISIIFKKLPVDGLKDLYEYTERWMHDGENGALRRAAAQLLGLLVDSRPDFVRRGTTANDVVLMVRATLCSVIASIEGLQVTVDDQWEVVYFCLVCLEKMVERIPSGLSDSDGVWSTAIVKCMVLSHSWIQQVSSRMIQTLLSRYSPSALNGGEKTMFVSTPGTVFEIARNTCRQISRFDEVSGNDSRPVSAVKLLSWCAQAMNASPQLCYKPDTDNSGNEEEDDVAKNSGKPLTWLLTRLSNIGRDDTDMCRATVFKAFAAISTTMDADAVARDPHLRLMIEPLQRVLSEVERNPKAFARRERGNNKTTEDKANIADLANDVMSLLEQKVGAEQYLNALSAVKLAIRERQGTRKQALTTEAVLNPKTAAKRKIDKQARNTKRKKRKSEDRRKKF